jgi:hypothetical protein
MRRGIVAALLAGVTAAGCGGGGGGSKGTPSAGATLTATGTVAFTAGNATSVTGAASCDVAGVTYGMAYAALLASDQSGICGYLQRNQDKASARSIQVAVFRADLANTTTTLTTGSYPVVANPTTETMFAFVSVSQNDASCSARDVSATGGTVTVSSTASGRLQGTVDVTLSDGGTVTGSFDAAACAVTFPGDLCSGQIGPQNPTCAP